MEWQFILILCVGLLAMFMGVLIAIMRVRTVFFGASADGVVVSQSESSGGRTHGKIVTLYAPIVEFQHAGKKIKFTSSMGQRESIANGTKVRVRYLPSDPASTAEIGSSMRMWGFPIAALFVGSIFVAIALYGSGYLGTKP
jgi:Protein of unknown function (DUF3592)